MTFRTRSRGRQWLVWCGLTLVALTVAVVWSFLAAGSVGLDYFRPSGNRLALPVFALFVYLGWEMRWDGIRRGKRDEGWGMRDGEVKAEGQEKLKLGVEVEERNLTSGAAEPLNGTRGLSARPAGQSVDATSSSRQNKDETSSDRRDGDVASTKESHVHCTPTPSTCASVSSSSDDATGEALFAQARALRHRKIPGFKKDAEYLDLLGKSAAAGYAPALAKLGEYAMRRRAWVEAYYWMKQAQRNGMHGLSPTLREIRKNWSRNGFPGQSSNVNQLFTAEAGSLGRALLHVDSGHEAAKAKEFLKANYPEFLF